MVVLGETREATRDKVTGRKDKEEPLKYFRVWEDSSLAETTSTEVGEEDSLESLLSSLEEVLGFLAVGKQLEQRPLNAYEDPIIVDTRKETIITA